MWQRPDLVLSGYLHAITKDTDMKNQMDDGDFDQVMSGAMRPFGSDHPILGTWAGLKPGGELSNYHCGKCGECTDGDGATCRNAPYHKYVDDDSHAIDLAPLIALVTGSFDVVGERDKQFVEHINANIDNARTIDNGDGWQYLVIDDARALGEVITSMLTHYGVYA